MSRTERSRRLDPNRPYDGQPHTDYGERGKQPIWGLTMRDVIDAFVEAAHQSCPTPADDLYNLPLDDIDPGAWAQNLGCELERRMGIYPNVPELLPRDPREPHWCGSNLDTAEWTSHDGPCPTAPRKKAWCLTCQRTHIAHIPQITYRCSACGFGSWDAEMARDHDNRWGEAHVTYRVGHILVPHPGGDEDAGV